MISSLRSPLTGLATACAAIAAGVVVKMLPIPEGGDYVGSRSCAACHAEVYEQWSGSLHTKMMRPVEAPGVVVADFDSTETELGFDREEAVWAIGGKWEQQFMGHDGVGETLLPGVWLRSSGQWDFKGWDGWQTPEPLRRCHGCHTVGLDVETGRFVEPNIGCESCHGPASWHVETRGLGRVYSSVAAEVCGQCHTRGTTPDGAYFFPMGFRPGLDLSEHFDPNLPSPGQNSSYWWGSGHERKRHQEYDAWAFGGHASSLKTLREDYGGRYGTVSGECLACHSGDHALPEERRPRSAATAGVTCAVCHNVHGELDKLRTECSECHGAGAFHHEPSRNAEHVACGSDAEVGCVDCHMPKTGSIGGEFAIHSHRAGIIPPTHTDSWGTPSSCANGGCHVSTSTAQLQAWFERAYR